MLWRPAAFADGGSLRLTATARPRKHASANLGLNAEFRGGIKEFVGRIRCADRAASFDPSEDPYGSLTCCS